MYINKKEVRQKIKESEMTFFKTGFKFLNSHKSFRPGCIHTFLGKSGQGKSTLMRSMLIELLSVGKVFLWLSEESEINLCVNFLRREISEELTENLTVYSEIDSNIIDRHDLELDILNNIETTNPDAIIFDNITTSSAYTEDYKIQGELASKIKALATRYNVPMIVFAHTKSGMREDRLLEDEDIRGSKKISNLSDYFYVIQMFNAGSEKYPTVRVLKSRYHDNARSRSFLLNYNSKIMAYTHDAEMDFLRFKEIFKLRDKLV